MGTWKKADAEEAAGEEENPENPYTGVGRFGTAPPLTSHGGRSRVPERKGGKTLQDALTASCHALLQKFIGEPTARDVALRPTRLSSSHPPLPDDLSPLARTLPP